MRDPRGRVVEVTRPEGEVSSYAYDGRGRVTSMLNTGGSLAEVTTYAYGIDDEPLGSCQEVVSGACADFQSFGVLAFERAQLGLSLPPSPPNAVFSITSTDLEGRPVHRLGPDGIEHTTHYNAAGLPEDETVIGTPNTVSTTTYDVMGRPVQVVVGSGAERLRSFMRYDDRGRLTLRQTKQPLTQSSISTTTGTVERFGYDMGDRLVYRVVTGATGHTTPARAILEHELVEPNALGQPLHVHRLARSTVSTGISSKTVSGPQSSDVYATTSYRYDSAGRLVHQNVEGVSRPSFATYDHFGLTAVTTPDATKDIVNRPKAFDQSITTTWRTDGDADPTVTSSTRYRAFSRRGLLTTQLEWDAGLPGAQRKTTWEYDGLGRPTLRTDPTERFIRYERGALGRVHQVVEGRSGTDARNTHLSYDTRGRLIERVPAGAPSTHYQYDRSGRLVTESNAETTTDIVYDSAGRRHTITKAISNDARETTFTYSPNHVEYASVEVEETQAIKAERDGLGRPTFVQSYNAVLDKDAIGESSLPSSRPKIDTTRFYDALGRVLRERNIGTFPSTSPTQPGSTGLVLSDQTRIYSASNALGESDLILDSGDAIAKNYNASGRLANVTWVNSSGAKYTADFGYRGGLWSLASTAKATRRKVRDGFGHIVSSTMAAQSTWQEDILRGPTGRVVAQRITSPVFGERVIGHQYDPLARLSSTKRDDDTGVIFTQASAESAASSEQFDPVINPDAVVNHAHASADGLENASPDVFGRSFSATYDPTRTAVPPTSINIESPDQRLRVADGIISSPSNPGNRRLEVETWSGRFL